MGARREWSELKELLAANLGEASRGAERPRLAMSTVHTLRARALARDAHPRCGAAQARVALESDANAAALHSAAIDCAHHCGDWDWSLLWLQQMLDAGLMPSQPNLNGGLHAYACLQRPEEALLMLREMPMFGARPDTKSYGICVDACAQAGLFGP